VKIRATGVVLVVVLLVGAVLIWDMLSGAGVGSDTRPAFSGTTLQGEPWSLAEHRGKRPVLVSFFSTT
jgi:hypothetical protein